MASASGCAGKGCMTIIVGLTAWFALGVAYHSLKDSEMVKDASKLFRDTSKDVAEKTKETYESITGETKETTVPTGSFTVDFCSRKSTDKRFEFNVVGRDDTGKLKMKIREYGRQESDLGANARFNVVFWDSAEPEKEGLGFQVNLGRLGGVTLHKYNDHLPTLIITQSELVCGEFNNDGKIHFTTNPASRLKSARTLSRPELEIPEYRIRITPQAVRIHNKDNLPQIAPPYARTGGRDDR